MKVSEYKSEKKMSWNNYPGLASGSAFALFIIMLAVLTTCTTAIDILEEEQKQTIILEQLVNEKEVK